MDNQTANKILEKVKSDYQTIAKDFSDSRNYLWEELKGFEKYTNNDMEILDLGCGNGRLYEIFKGKNIKYTGIDNCARFIKFAQEKYPTVNFQIGNALDLKFENNKFDIVFAIALLHQIPSKELRLKVLKNINCALKNNGLLIMTNWDLWQPNYFKYVLLNNIKKLFNLSKLDHNDALIPWQKSGINRYYHAFTKSSLANLLSQTNFKILEHYYVKKGLPANWLNGYNLVTIAQKN